MRTKSEKKATTDALTGLANRQGFMEQASRVLEQLDDTVNVAIVYADLRLFKQINDHPELGHDIGDDVLKITGKALQLLTRHESIHSGEPRPPDALGRLGGDEFAMLLPLNGENSLTAEELQALAEHIIAAKATEATDVAQHAISATIQEYPGIAELSPESRELLRQSIGINTGMVLTTAGELRKPDALQKHLKLADGKMYEHKRRAAAPSPAT